MRYNLDRSFYIPKEHNMVIHGDAVVYEYDNATGRPAAVAFKGRANKPAWHFWFPSIERRDAKIKSWFDSLDQWDNFKQERKQSRAREVAQSDIRPGDYFYTSWGYDQTNIDYIVIVSVSPTGKTVTARRADSIHVGESGTSDILMPGTAVGDIFRLKVSGRDNLTGSYPYIIGYKDTRTGYFSKVKLGDVKYQTMPEFGH